MYLISLLCKKYKIVGTKTNVTIYIISQLSEIENLDFKIRKSLLIRWYLHRNWFLTLLGIYSTLQKLMKFTLYITYKNYQNVEFSKMLYGRLQNSFGVIFLDEVPRNQ